MASPRRSRAATWTRRGLIVVAGAIVLYFAWLLWDYDAVIAWMQRARVFPFFLAMALLPAVGLPITPFLLLAGATFGVSTALIGTAIAIAANFTLCYWIGRSGLRPRLLSLLDRFGYNLPDFNAADQPPARAVRFAALLKVAPGVPAFIKNYGLGAAHVPYGIALVVTLLISGAYAAALIVLGESVFEHDLGRGAIALAVIAVLAGIVWWRGRKRNEDLAAAIP